MKGNVIVPPKYIQVEDYQDGMAEVCVYDSTHSVRIGYVDLNGNEVIPAVYASPTSTSAEGFNDGYVWVKGSPTNAFHYMLLDKAGDTVLELPGYEVEWTSSYGISKVTQDTKCFQPVTCFSNGYAVLEFVGFQYTESDNIGYFPVTAKEDLGLTDYMLIDLQGDLTPFDKDFFYSGDGTYWNQWDNYMKRGFVLSYSSGRYGVLDQNGAVSIPYLYGEMQRDPFLNGVAMVQRDSGEPGSIIDLKGNTIIPEGEWQSLSAFVDGYALATQTGKSDEGYYTIDTYLLTIEGAGSSAPADRPPPQPAADHPSSWAAGQVDEAVSAGIVPENLRSAYTQSITRAEFCALATRLYETVKGTAIAERVTFTDTTDENVEKMAALGVVTGTGDGRLRPRRPPDPGAGRHHARPPLRRGGRPSPRRVPHLLRRGLHLLLGLRGRGPGPGRRRHERHRHRDLRPHGALHQRAEHPHHAPPLPHRLTHTARKPAGSLPPAFRLIRSCGPALRVL